MGFEPIRLAAPPPQDGESTNFSIWPKIKKKKLSWCLTSFCDPAGIRTQDPYIKSVMLYQLSYRVEKTISSLRVQIYDDLFILQYLFWFNLIIFFNLFITP